MMNVSLRLNVSVEHSQLHTFALSVLFASREYVTFVIHIKLLQLPASLRSGPAVAEGRV